MQIKNNKAKILDLGCGRNKIKGAIGVDNVKLEDIDIVHDLKVFPYPFETNSIDKVYCRHILEHFEPDTRNRIIEEVHRILKLGGRLVIRVPHAFCIAAKLDPTHKSFYCFRTILYFTKNHKFSYYADIKCHFTLEATRVNFILAENKNNFVLNLFERVLTDSFNRFFSFKRSTPDLIVKFLPFSDVEIVWILRKE